jgi:UDPglucose--hexose-1-phosphate uridylyltransferase
MLNVHADYLVSVGCLTVTFNEVRKDYLLDRWVVIATARGRRPTDFAKKEKKQAKQGICPMCPGNEHMTPPAVLVYLKSGRGIKKARDKDGFRHKNWLVRCVPNLFPAFAPPKQRMSREQIMKSSDLALAVGHHEVLIESPVHDAHPADAKISQLTHVINAYVGRLRELSAKPYVRYVSIFRNHGLEAGASLSHAHSQIITTPFVPKTLKGEFKASREFWKQNRKCVFCDILEKEQDGPRLILENTDFVAFAPYASVHPMEFWILPKKHEATVLTMSQEEVKSFAETLKTCLAALKRLVDDPPYNYAFHLTINKEDSRYFHWHLEVYPQLAIWAGFEKSTGVYINTVTPEVAAEDLKKTISS